MFVAAPNTRLLFHDGRSFVDRARRMLLEIGFQAPAIAVKFARRFGKRKLAQCRDASRLVEAEIRTQRIFCDGDEPTNLSVCDALAFEPKNFHPLLDSWMRMVEPLVMKSLFFGVREGQLEHKKPDLAPQT